jgi:hypothetical protein
VITANGSQSCDADLQHRGEETAMPKVAFHADLKATPEAAEIKTHNRWHPDLPMVETFKPGAEFRVECFDWTGGQIAPDDSANDVRDVGFSRPIPDRNLPLIRIQS